MLGDSNVVAVVAVKNMATGNEFYGGTLGLRESDMDEPGGTLYSCGGGSLLLVYESSYAGTNEATAASWQVGDIEQEISELTAKGVSLSTTTYRVPPGKPRAHPGQPEGGVVQRPRRQHPRYVSR